MYFAQLIENSRKPETYAPTFTFAKGSKKASQTRGQQWDDITFSAEVDIYDEDLEFFSSPTSTAQDVSEHLAFMVSEARRKNRGLTEKLYGRGENIDGRGQG